MASPQRMLSCSLNEKCPDQLMYLNTVPQLVLLFKVRGPLECEALLEEACRWRRALRTPGLLHLQLAYSASCV